MTSSKARLATIWPTLTDVQRRYVVARQQSTTKKEAAEAVGVHPDTVYRWPDSVEEAVRLFVDCTADAARAEITAALAKAAMLKVKELDSPDPHIAARARTEILDRGLGKATQRTEAKVEGTFDITVERIDELTAQLAKRAAGLRGEMLDVRKRRN